MRRAKWEAGFAPGPERTDLRRRMGAAKRVFQGAGGRPQACRQGLQRGWEVAGDLAGKSTAT